ncbi:Os12g0236325 [Oryza sativa Japonica Group]|uniref:Uncharacterized protein n=2 Tax=Oryza sativa subsp. japonica TaxID=39947 RepID=A0A8J8Y656_ORYSJ|nr:hypothetical protein OsJ_35670 [Oryza sativa Japonica Group]BAT16471.1 Os12g0236325 [Oryza sativa Japonica Group]
MIPVPIPAAAIPVPSRAPFHVPVGSRPDDNSSCRKLYEPRLVAIRPYHHGRDELHAMEQHKWRFLQRAPTVPLSDFVDAVRAVEQRARCCYSESTAILDDDGDGFAEMLLLDGCFILEFSAKLSRAN